MFKIPTMVSQLFVLGSWSLAVGYGLLSMQQYDNFSTSASIVPEIFPDDTTVHPGDGKQSLLVFVHPHCPCSRATIGELERIVARTDDRLATTVVFWHPTKVARNWHETSLWSWAQSIPGVQVVDDVDGLISGRFHVQTSGQALFYDASGKLQFAGGITKARGHAGDNFGSDTIAALLKDEVPSQGLVKNCCAVYGCALSENRSIDIPGDSQK